MNKNVAYWNADLEMSICQQHLLIFQLRVYRLLGM
ncbi:hypothetical protein AZE42_03999 [Rhizopogon vesiculosus]|uniref:Uncharacterized protein n=1 Tax=Rhizopogon vesiculosus TaxID=180088 RepID=A0A1J8R1U0_9AGAM|nr:hypothetical protein AZE42_03999 [Rhizopogon vesiculosus]